ncbi:NACHT, LRR and PYD domains-containing protein 13 [Coemansia sp. RSA 2424]|nr:NACHT, LRR and PYD domains-containing protein 13 [Coemansia sp. RSA 2424]
MDIVCIVESAPAGIAPTVALPKSRSNASLNSASSADNSPTLCEQARELGAADNGAAALSHSREICFLDLTPGELSVSEALGGRSPATIECLRINRCRMDGKAFACLVDDLCSHDLPSLHTVDVSQNQLSGIEAGAALARLLSQARAVRFLSLGWNKLSLADLRPVIADATAAMSGAHNVECLDLRANPLTAPVNSKRSSKKSSKRLHAVEADDEWLGSLVACMPKLTHVQLAQAAIGDKPLISLLRSLTRTGSAIEYIGLEWLGLGNRLPVLRAIMANLAPPSQVLHLNLSANHLGDSGVEVIATSGAVLSSLTLACNFITERGTGMLAKWLPISGLRTLDLSDNYFGDQGVISLLATHTSNAAAGTPAKAYGYYCTQLIELGLTSCCLSDTSLRLITEALKCNWAPLELLRIIRNSRMSPGAKLLL